MSTSRWLRKGTSVPRPVQDQRVSILLDAPHAERLEFYATAARMKPAAYAREMIIGKLSLLPQIEVSD